MTTPRPRDGEHDEIDGLLPWYVNGTLAADERAAVDEHLATCPTCRAELRQQRELAELVRGRGDLAPAPHPQGLERLLARIDETPDEAPLVETLSGDAEAADAQSPRSPRALPTDPGSPGRWTGLRRFRAPESSNPAAAATSDAAAWRSRRRPWRRLGQLAAAAAVVALVAGLAWRLPRGEASDARFHTLSHEVPPAVALTRLHVVFDAALPERDLRALLLPLRAEIVGGPSPLGVYTVAVPAGRSGDEPEAWLLEHLRTSPGVRFAEVAAPGPDVEARE